MIKKAYETAASGNTDAEIQKASDDALLPLAQSFIEYLVKNARDPEAKSLDFVRKDDLARRYVNSFNAYCDNPDYNAGFPGQFLFIKVRTFDVSLKQNNHSPELAEEILYCALTRMQQAQEIVYDAIIKNKEERPIPVIDKKSLGKFYSKEVQQYLKPSDPV